MSFLRVAATVGVQPAHVDGNAVSVHRVVQGTAVTLRVLDEKGMQAAEPRALMQ